MYTVGASSKYYNNLIAQVIGYEIDEIEIYKRTIYQRHYSTYTMEIKAVCIVMKRLILIYVIIHQNLLLKDIYIYIYISYRR